MENQLKGSNSSFFAFSKTVGTSPRNSTLLQNITNLSNTFQRSIISTSKSKN